MIGAVIIKKKTHEEYVAQVAEINPNIEVIGHYTGSMDKTLHRCKIDGYEWYVIPNSILHGTGCPKCNRLKQSEKYTKTHSQYVLEVAKINPNIEVVGEYAGCETPILHRCKIDGYEWSTTPNSILSGTGCPRCVKCEKYGHDEYVRRVSEINPNIEVVGRYVDAKTKILHRCKIDGNVWNAVPCHILRGNGCLVCYKNKRTKTHEQYVKEVAEINANIEVVGLYVDNHTNILHRCKIDGYEWLASPRNILSGKGCPVCAGNKKCGHEEYIKKVAKINNNIEVVGTYINAHTSILHRCKIDGNEWYATPNRILSGRGCPKCNESKGEKIIANWLDENNILYEPQKRFENCRSKKPLPFDFYLPHYNICIEYNGIQHYEPIDYFGGEERFKENVKRDKIKENYCSENNICLIKIAYNMDIYEELQKLYELLALSEVA